MGCVVRAGALSVPLALGGCSNIPEETVEARYWTDHRGWVNFPELDRSDAVWGDLKGKDDFGIVFSGGGTRSAAATIGQLRGLRETGLLDRARYLSAVSGGSWAALPFTFISEDRLDDFLEDYRPPDDLTLADFAPGERSMTRAISEAYVTGKGLSHLANRRGSETFARTVADSFLRPFGLGDPESWFTWSEKTAREVLARNPGLPTRYHTVPAGRPYLVVGGTIRHYDLFPSKWSEMTGAKRIPVEFTPLYCGVRPFVPANGHTPHPIGGGYVESFAYDTILPVKAGPTKAEASFYRRGWWDTAPQLTLGDVIGSSGAAPGEVSLAVELIGFPKYNHWSPRVVDEIGKADDGRYAQQDGGHSENLGIIPLLARKVPRILAFVNSQEKVVVEKGKTVFPNYVRGLFGGEDVKKYTGSQVFSPEEMKKVAEKMWASVERGGPAVATVDLPVMENQRFGVAGGWTVRVCWVFLEAESERSGRASENWIEEIPGGTPARRLFDSSNREMRNFPNLGTFFENKGLRLWDVIRYTPEQATALAHYGAWSAVASETEIKALFRD